MQRKQPLMFFGLVVALLGGRAIEWKSLSAAIGAGVIEIPASIAIGRIAIWFVEKLFLFARNVAAPAPLHRRSFRGTFVPARLPQRLVRSRRPLLE